MVLVYLSAWSPVQVLANMFCFCFLLQVSEVEENVNVKIRYQNSTEQKVMTTLEYRCDSSEYGFRKNVYCHLIFTKET
jgi:hypothetical protein